MFLTLYGDCMHIVSMGNEKLSPTKENAPFSDVVILPKGGTLSDSAPKKCALFLVDAEEKSLPEALSAAAALSCGMCAHDTVSFSSVSEKEAQLCLTRAFFFHNTLIEPQEKKVPFDPTLSLYQNLTRGLLLTLSHII